MNKNIVYISDFFLEDVCGGAELNDCELLNMLSLNGFDIQKIKSHDLKKQILDLNKDCFFIVSNFTNLSRESKE